MNFSRAGAGISKPIGPQAIKLAGPPAPIRTHPPRGSNRNKGLFHIRSGSHLSDSREQ